MHVCGERMETGMFHDEERGRGGKARQCANHDVPALDTKIKVYGTFLRTIFSVQILSCYLFALLSFLVLYSLELQTFN